MPQLRYGGRLGQVIQYEVDPDLLAVRTRSKQSFRSGPVPRPEAALLEEMELVAEFPEAGVGSIPEAAGSASIGEDGAGGVEEGAGHAVCGARASGGAVEGTGRIYREHLCKVPRRRGRGRLREVLRQAGLTVKRELAYAPNAFFAAAPEGTGQEVFTIANMLLSEKTLSIATQKLCSRRCGEPSLLSSGI